jgi:hypothetical protein
MGQMDLTTIIRFYSNGVGELAVAASDLGCRWRSIPSLLWELSSRQLRVGEILQVKRLRVNQDCVTTYSGIRQSADRMREPLYITKYQMKADSALASTYLGILDLP